MSNNSQIFQPSSKALEIMQKEQVTPTEVKEVIVECFCQAHGDYEQGILIMKHKAIEAGMYWENPTKLGLLSLVPKLAEVAVKFRNRDVIIKNQKKVEELMMKCVDPA